MQFAWAAALPESFDTYVRFLPGLQHEFQVEWRANTAAVWQAIVPFTTRRKHAL